MEKSELIIFRIKKDTTQEVFDKLSSQIQEKADQIGFNFLLLPNCLDVIRGKKIPDQTIELIKEALKED